MCTQQFHEASMDSPRFTLRLIGHMRYIACNTDGFLAMLVELSMLFLCFPCSKRGF